MTSNNVEIKLLPSVARLRLIIYSIFEIPRKPKIESISMTGLNGNSVIRGFTTDPRVACADYRLEFRIFLLRIIDSHLWFNNKDSNARFVSSRLHLSDARIHKYNCEGSLLKDQNWSHKEALPVDDVHLTVEWIFLIRKRPKRDIYMSVEGLDHFCITERNLKMLWACPEDVLIS